MVVERNRFYRWMKDKGICGNGLNQVKQSFGACGVGLAVIYRLSCIENNG